MTDVLLFPSSTDGQKIWTCGCGCGSFVLVDDGSAECAACGLVPETGADAGWHDRIVSGGDRDASLEPPVVDINANGDVDFARRRVAQMASDADAVIVLVVRRGGEVSLWNCCEGDAGRDWGREMLDAAVGLYEFQTEGASDE